jgi:hypothetical protein
MVTSGLLPSSLEMWTAPSLATHFLRRVMIGVKPPTKADSQARKLVEACLLMDLDLRILAVARTVCVFPGSITA